MALPVAAAWMVTALGRVALRVMTPALIALSAWGMEQLTGVVSWVVLRFGDLLLGLLLEQIATIRMPAAPNWAATFGVTILDLIEVSGIDVAFGVVILSLSLRLVVKLVTLGRF